MKAIYILIIVIFSIGKIIAATGQTLFNVQHTLFYFFNNIGQLINSFSIFAAGCTLFVVSITRVPALYRQFRMRTKQEKPFIMNDISFSFYKRFFYYVLVNSNVISGIFSSVGAYLGTLTLIEIMMNIDNHPTTLNEMMIHQAFAIFIAISSFASYYSFNIHKAKLNSIKLTSKIKYKKLNIFIDQKLLKTFAISLLNVMSLPFIAYFLTKNAIYKMPYVSDHLAIGYVQGISAFSSITALVASLTVTVPAMHEYLTSEKQTYETSSPSWKMLRYSTYATGLVDSSANGMGNFLGFITISHDIFNINLYNMYIIVIGIGCGLSATLLNLAFSIRQGFNEVVNYVQPKNRLADLL